MAERRIPYPANWPEPAAESSVKLRCDSLEAGGWVLPPTCEANLALPREPGHSRRMSAGLMPSRAEVDLHLADSTDYFLSARLNISIRGIDRTVAQDLVQQAEQLCPYSKATRGNIDVTFNLLTT